MFSFERTENECFTMMGFPYFSFITFFNTSCTTLFVQRKSTNKNYIFINVVIFQFSQLLHLFSLHSKHIVLHFSTNNLVIQTIIFMLATLLVIISRFNLKS